MDRNLVFENPDGTIGLLWVAPNPGRMADAEWEEYAIGGSEFAGCKRMDDCDPNTLPQGRFTPCWRNDGTGKVHVDMPLARVQRMGEIRAERNALLDSSDKEKSRLDDVGTASQKTAIGAYRQALRDLPAAVDLEIITTPEALEAFEPVWPVLNGGG